MIPRHSLPFGFSRMLSEWISPRMGAEAADLEKAYAETLQVRVVLLLPSVRAGIHMAIEAAGARSRAAVIPVYTCDTVHRALALSGVPTRPVDSAPNAFLMDPDGIAAAAEQDCVLLLSEVYGIPYDTRMIERVCPRPGLRVLDLAMGIPSSERLRLLKAEDVALYSFGWGKPMYTGWGGIACFMDPDLAGKVREIRNKWSIPESPGLRFRQDFSTLLRVALNERFIYGIWHEQHLYGLYRASQNEKGPPMSTRHDLAPGVLSFAARSLPPEWTRPMTALNRKLALYNLRQAGQNAGLRQRQVEIYYSSLAETGVVRGLASSSLPQSHFPVRVPPVLRNRMGDDLRSRGIDTSTLFPLPAGMDPRCYPQAASASQEVITLPLGPAVTLGEVRRIAERVKTGLRALGYD